MTTAWPSNDAEWCFGTPWHWCVHGLPVGGAVTGAFDPGWPRRLSRFAVELGGEARVGWWVSLSSSLVSPDAVAEPLAVDDGPAASTELIAWRALAGARGPGLLGLAQLMRQALHRASDGRPARSRYLQVYDVVRLLLAFRRAPGALRAAGRGECRALLSDSLAACRSLDDPFQRLRAQAVLLAAASAALEGPPPGLLQDGATELMALLRGAYAELRRRPPDAVHRGADHAVFAASLSLLAVAALGRPDLATRGENWPAVLREEAKGLDPRSRASQGLFYASAMRSIGAMSADEAAALGGASARSFVGLADGSACDDYLRCAYLARWLGLSGCAADADRLWDLLQASLERRCERDSPEVRRYSSASMRAGYALLVMSWFPSQRARLEGAVLRCLEARRRQPEPDHDERLRNAWLAVACIDANSAREPCEARAGHREATR